VAKQFQGFLAALLTGAALLGAGNAHATPGIGTPVYGADAEKGVTEIEVRYGALTGGVADGEDGLVLEVEHGFNDHWQVGLLVGTERGPGGPRQVTSLGVEVIRTLGHSEALGLDFAAYGEYKIGFKGEADEAEVKLLMQHEKGNFDARLNLIAEKALRRGNPMELGYAASVDWGLDEEGEFRLGLAAFGDFGTTRRLFGREQHFVGPVAKMEIEHLGPGALEIEAGWLRAFGAARDVTKGQARLLVGYEFKF
jgi:hypothetical protein